MANVVATREICLVVKMIKVLKAYVNKEGEVCVFDPLESLMRNRSDSKERMTTCFTEVR